MGDAGVRIPLSLRLLIKQPACGDLSCPRESFVHLLSIQVPDSLRVLLLFLKRGIHR